MEVPNMTHPEAPVGAGEDANRVVKTWGELPKFDFQARSTMSTLMERLDLVDLEAGARVAGHGFYFLKNEAVLLELALVQFALEKLRAEGFTLFTTPDLARDDVLSGIGFLPRGPEAQIYSIENSDLSLVATAEITLGGSQKDQILDASVLAAQIRRPLALLPHRGGRPRPGHAGHLPRPPVHEGRDVRLHGSGSGRVECPALARSSRSKRACSSRSSFPTA